MFDITIRIDPDAIRKTSPIGFDNMYIHVHIQADISTFSVVISYFGWISLMFFFPFDRVTATFSQAFWVLSWS